MEAMHFSLGPTVSVLHALAKAVDKQLYMEVLVEPRQCLAYTMSCKDCFTRPHATVL